MIKNLIHLTLISVIWKKYRNMIVSTLLLFIYFWLVSMVHGDFVNYSELNSDKQYLALSFFIKWLAFLLGVVIYLIFNSRYSSRKLKDKNSGKASAKKDAVNTTETNQADPFEQIRRRDKLRSRADFIIQKNTDKND